MFSLTNKVALVTGASSGMGYETAKALAHQGATVILTARRMEKLEALKKEIESMGGKALTIQMDVTNKQEITNAVTKTIETFGKIDILINNAGALDFTPFVDITEEKWNMIIDTNLKGYFLIAQTVVKEMIKQKSGTIVNIASIAAYIGMPMLAHYAASKGGIIALTKSMAMELGQYNIRVNAIAPGAIKTEMNTSDDISTYSHRLAIKRVGKAEEIAAGVIYLVSDEAGYTTGTTITIDGGWTAS